jgi:hypothetical protein
MLDEDIVPLRPLPSMLMATPASSKACVNAAEVNRALWSALKFWRYYKSSTWEKPLQDILPLAIIQEGMK